MSTRREKTLAFALVALGAVLGLLAASRPWVSALVDDPVAGRLAVAASGRQAAPVVPAVALVALAGALAVVTAGRVGRVVAGVLLVLAGAAAATASLAVVSTPRPSLEAVLATATGRSGGARLAVSVSAWPWAGAAAGVLMALGGALAVVRAGRWSGLSARYDAPAVPAPTALPTGPAPTNATGGPPAALDGPPAPDGQDERDRQADAWDALTRGEDPTR